MIRITMNREDLGKLIRGGVVEREVLPTEADMGGNQTVQIILEDIDAQTILEGAAEAYAEFVQAHDPTVPAGPQTVCLDCLKLTIRCECPEEAENVGPGQQSYDSENPPNNWDFLESLLSERQASGKEDGPMLVLAALLAGRQDPPARAYVFEKLAMLARLQRDSLMANLLDGAGVSRLVGVLVARDDIPIVRLAMESRNWRAF